MCTVRNTNLCTKQKHNENSTECVYCKKHKLCTKQKHEKWSECTEGNIASCTEETRTTVYPMETRKHVRRETLWNVYPVKHEDVCEYQG